MSVFALVIVVEALELTLNVVEARVVPAVVVVDEVVDEVVTVVGGMACRIAR